MVKDNLLGLMHTLSCMPSKMEENSVLVLLSEMIIIAIFQLEDFLISI